MSQHVFDAKTFAVERTKYRTCYGTFFCQRQGAQVHGAIEHVRQVFTTLCHIQGILHLMGIEPGSHPQSLESDRGRAISMIDAM